MAFSTRKTGGWKTRARLQQFEGQNIGRAQQFALRLRQRDKNLPKKMSLVGLYEGAQSRFTQGVEALAKQDEVARLVLGIIKPPPPEIEVVEHYEPQPVPFALEFTLNTGSKDIKVNTKSVSFYVDKHLKDGKTIRHTIGSVIYIRSTPEIMALAKKTVLIGKRFDDPFQKEEQEKRMANLRKRLADPDFISCFSTGEQLAIIDIREYPAEAGAQKNLLQERVNDVPQMIADILTAATTKQTESDGFVLEVEL